MKGVYVLLFSLPEQMIVEVGALGNLTLKGGYYAYVGSAQRAMDSRLARHVRREKKPHWHIDRLTPHGDNFSALVMSGPKSAECELASRLSRTYKSILGFGSSDCSCPSHLFHLGHPEAALRDLKDMFGEMSPYPINP